MHTKLLFPATLALAVASTVALTANAGPLTRADVVGAYQQAVADHTLRKSDYDFDKPDAAVGPARSRDAVIAEMSRNGAPSPLLGPLRSRTYNPYGTELSRPSTVERARVRAEVLTAMRDGTLRHTEDQDLPLRGVRRTVAPLDRPMLANAGR